MNNEHETKSAEEIIEKIEEILDKTANHRFKLVSLSHCADKVAAEEETYGFQMILADIGEQIEDSMGDAKELLDSLRPLLSTAMPEAPTVPTTEDGTPITDFGLPHERAWETAKRLYPELYTKLEAAYPDGKARHTGREAHRDSILYTTEEIAVMLDYLILKAPRFTEAILKLQIAALGEGLPQEERDKLFTVSA